jgi:hypothetical protein
MHRKPLLQDAARKLQELFNNRTGEISYVQALEILSELEGFEGHQQLRAFLTEHTQSRGKSQQPAGGLTASPAPVAKLPTSSSTGESQSLAMTLCGHGGFHSGYKRIDLGRPDVRFVQFQSGEIRSIEFGEGRTALMHLADVEAGFPSETGMNPKETVALVGELPRNGGLSFHITVEDMRDAEHVYGGQWKVAGRTLTFLDCHQLHVPVKTERTFPKPSEMTHAQYLDLDAELERLERAHAMGEEYDGMYVRMKQIDALLGASPWVRDMDSGEVVLASESVYGTLRSTDN